MTGEYLKLNCNAGINRGITVPSFRFNLLLRDRLTGPTSAKTRSVKRTDFRNLARASKSYEKLTVASILDKAHFSRGFPLFPAFEFDRDACDPVRIEQSTRSARRDVARVAYLKLVRVA